MWFPVVFNIAVQQSLLTSRLILVLVDYNQQRLSSSYPKEESELETYVQIIGRGLVARLRINLVQSS